MTAKPVILVIDQDENIRGLLKNTLEGEGYRVNLAGDGEEGLQLAAKINPELVIVDLDLPGMSGMKVCRVLAPADSQIIVLTAKVEGSDRVIALDLGASDYITKPFSVRELLARIRAVTRRTPHQLSPVSKDMAPEILTSGDLRLNLTSHAATLANSLLYLKPKEFKLLTVLITRHSRLCTKSDLLRAVWGEQDPINHHTLVVHIRRLREKIEIDPSNPTRIITLRGVGYRFDG